MCMYIYKQYINYTLYIYMYMYTYIHNIILTI